MKTIDKFNENGHFINLRIILNISQNKNVKRKDGLNANNDYSERFQRNIV